MPLFGRLSAPVFDMCWLNLPDNDPVVLMPGGGGSTKSGVSNSIQIAKIFKNKFQMLPSLETDMDDKSNLCSAICSGMIKDISVVVAAIDNFCHLYIVQPEPDGVGMELALKFQADFGEEGSSLNCVCLLPTGVVITGGDDAVCRVWIPRLSKSGEWTIALASELKGHTAAIMAINHHPIDRLICTASKDGTCKIWSLSNLTCVGTGICLDVMPGAFPDENAPTNVNAKLPTVECRGCCFSADGEYLYTIQCMRRGETILAKWELIPYLNDEDIVVTPSSNPTDEKAVKKASKKVASKKIAREPSFLIDVIPCDFVVACKVPSTRLKASESGDFLAVGGSDGTVNVFKTTTGNGNGSNSMEKVFSEQCHDLPVTGLGFAPHGYAYPLVGTPELLVSCSADNKVAAFKVGGISWWFILLMIVLTLAFLLSLTSLTILLFFEDLSLQILKFIVSYGKEMHFEL